jgi:hypothetical protein
MLRGLYVSLMVSFLAVIVHGQGQYRLGVGGHVSFSVGPESETSLEGVGPGFFIAGEYQFENVPLVVTSSIGYTAWPEVENVYDILLDYTDPGPSGYGTLVQHYPYTAIAVNFGWKVTTGGEGVVPYLHVQGGIMMFTQKRAVTVYDSNGELYQEYVLDSRFFQLSPGIGMMIDVGKYKLDIGGTFEMWDYADVGALSLKAGLYLPLN